MFGLLRFQTELEGFEFDLVRFSYCTKKFQTKEPINQTDSYPSFGNHINYKDYPSPLTITSTQMIIVY